MQEWTPTIIYLLCLATSAICAWLLIRSYRRNRIGLLLWSAACFVFLALNNLLVVVDILIFPTAIDLSMLRQLTSLAGVLTLLYGFIWEVD
jgi:hypothetical protein